ncbi:MAG: T9SS sorting signal type C domain-containing protein [Chitinophagaceae bacterium]|nr:MAG: T9SS sorting signal type C domain-containing protein [Chitinophagaceae bacterium]
MTIVLKDKVLNVLHDLKEGPYNFTTAAGEFNNRFDIIYKKKPAAINTSGPSISQTAQVVAAVNRNAISVVASDTMQRVDVYDLTGKKLFTSDNIQSAETQISSLEKKNTILLLAILMEDGQQFTQKVLF